MRPSYATQRINNAEIKCKHAALTPSKTVASHLQRKKKQPPPAYETNEVRTEGQNLCKTFVQLAAGEHDQSHSDAIGCFDV